MNKPIIRNNILNLLINFIKKNLRALIIFSIAFFIIFLTFQIYNIYSLSKIKNNSITFYDYNNLEDLDLNLESLNELSDENNFYGILSKLELIKINIDNKKYKKALVFYMELLENKNINSIYKSAIASRASFQFIDINFNDLTLNYSKEILNFINYIDDQLSSYKGLKLELNYLVKILKIEKDNIDYQNFNEAINIYNSIMNSDDISSALKERINKIHEFLSYK
jgi:hypothetical protein